MKSMGLEKYRNKRNFSHTSEPRPVKPKKPRPGLAYVVQKHAASRLHYDLRLEEGGVLRSLAVPKEPPVREGVKRLAVQVEDHPYEYKDFEGTIPEGEYGAGKVEIWDRGEYVLVEKTPGKWVVDIKGGRLRGRFALIQLKAKDKTRRDNVNWLFFKLKKGA